MTMKYMMIAAIAVSMAACSNETEDRMEERSDRNDRYGTPEMSGDRDQMREPIDQVNPPEDVIPFDHEIRDDSTIAPVEGATNSGTDPKLMDAERPDNMDRPQTNSSGNTVVSTTTDVNSTGTSTTPATTTTPKSTGTTASPEGSSPGSDQGTSEPMDTSNEAVPANPN